MNPCSYDPSMCPDVTTPEGWAFLLLYIAAGLVVFGVAWLFHEFREHLEPNTEP